MTPTPVRSLLLAAAAAVVLVACSASAAVPPPVAPPPAAEQPGEEPSSGDDPLPPEPVVSTPIVASWDPGAAPVDLGDGRTVGDCEGDVPALCVTDGETVLGLLEESRHPAPPELLGVTGDDLDRALRDFAAERLSDIEADRLVGCGADHRVLPDAPGSLTIDGAPGLRYGFATVTGDEVIEHVVTWATVREGELRLVVAHAAAPDGCMASELTTFATDELVTLLPVLDRVMAGTQLPD